jgi:uncharacterized protein
MNFIGRKTEIESLASLDFSQKSKLTVVYGRRRVGKSTLIRKTFEKSKILIFEGLEGEPTSVQKTEFLSQCHQQLKTNNKFPPPAQHSSWSDILIYLSKLINKKPTVILFDEFQWLASERKELVSHLKYVWDNFFLNKNRIHLILCGSVSSFLVKKVLKSKALYGRVDLEIHLEPLSYSEIKEGFLNKRSHRESLEAYMTVGGVPRYLELFNDKLSVLLNLQRLAFHPQGYLFCDFDKIFVSHFGKNPVYKKIILSLAKHNFLTRNQLITQGYETSGGRMTEYLEELLLADFIEKYQPLDRPITSKLCRYRLKDNYLKFYFKFLLPFQKKIKNSFFVKKPLNLNMHQPYRIWLGLAFEKFCYDNHELLANKLGFSAVDYQYGSWFRREEQQTGCQIDLLFLRSDKVITLCEIKYQTRPIGLDVIQDVLKKIELLNYKKNYTVEPVLITASPPTNKLLQESFFSRILTVEQILN